MEALSFEDWHVFRRQPQSIILTRLAYKRYMAEKEAADMENARRGITSVPDENVSLDDFLTGQI